MLGRYKTLTLVFSKWFRLFISEHILTNLLLLKTMPAFNLQLMLNPCSIDTFFYCSVRSFLLSLIMIISLRHSESWKLCPRLVLFAHNWQWLLPIILVVEVEVGRAYIYRARVGLGLRPSGSGLLRALVNWDLGLCRAPNVNNWA
jgi:hypothetical protein